MFSSQAVLILIVICGVSSLSLPPQRNNVNRFRVNITESGTKFNEKLEVDTKEDTEIFHIPKHNNVDQSDIMHMFALNLTIFRFPLKGVCYVAPLERDQPPPKKLVHDMSQANDNYPAAGATIQSSSYRKTGSAQDFQFWNPRIQSFCRGLNVYHAEPFDKNSVTIESRDEKAERERRQAWTNSVRGYTSPCPPTDVRDCPEDQLYRHCYIEGHTCTYYRKCSYVYDNTQNQIVTDCDYIHRTDEIVCCTTRCDV